MRKFLSMLLVGLACCVSLPALAHHGWSLYQSGFTLTGTVSELKFGNAHDELVVTDEEGNAWAVLLAPPQRNRRMEFDEASISVNDQITLYGERHHDEEVREMKTERIERDGEEIYGNYAFKSAKRLAHINHMVPSLAFHPPDPYNAPLPQHSL